VEGSGTPILYKVNEFEVEELNGEDVKKALRNLKNNKATVTGGIHKKKNKILRK